MDTKIVITLSLALTCTLCPAIASGESSFVQEGNTLFQYDQTNKNNTGFARGNTNCAVQGSDNTLGLEGNTNGKFIGNQNVYRSKGATNVLLAGDGNQVTMEHGTNVKVEGDGNNCTLWSNTNLKVGGDRNLILATENTNVQIEGDENQVNASDNTNLEVVGIGNRFSCVGVVNHHLARVGGGSKINQMTITAITQGGSQGNQYPFKFFIEYVERAEINRTEYHVGIFKFSAVSRDMRLRITFDSKDYQNLNSTPPSQNIILTGGSKDNPSDKEELHIQGKGARISQEVQDGGMIQITLEVDQGSK